MVEEATHSVVVGADYESKKFSVTARMEQAHLRALQTRCVMRLEELLIAKNLSKDTAEPFKNALKDAYAAAGYTYQTRDPLS